MGKAVARGVAYSPSCLDARVSALLWCRLMALAQAAEDAWKFQALNKPLGHIPIAQAAIYLVVKVRSVTTLSRPAFRATAEHDLALQATTTAASDPAIKVRSAMRASPVFYLAGCARNVHPTHLAYQSVAVGIPIGIGASVSANAGGGGTDQERKR